jgi:Tfp pilus assembly protein PilN
VSARVNLLPREIEERARTRRSASWTIAGVALFAAVLGVVYLGKLGAVNGAREEREAAQGRVTELEAELATLQEFADLDREVKARNELLAAAMATEISWARTLNDLALTFPASSSLTELAAAAVGASADSAAADTDVTAAAIASLSFTGYSVERYAPGVERVLLKFSDVGMFFNAYLAQAATELRGETLVTGFNGSLELSEDARTGRYAEGLPPEVGQ